MEQDLTQARRKKHFPFQEDFGPCTSVLWSGIWPRVFLQCRTTFWPGLPLSSVSSYSMNKLWARLYTSFQSVYSFSGDCFPLLSGFCPSPFFFPLNFMDGAHLWNFLFLQGGYLLSGGCFLLLSCRLSVSFPSPLFSLLVMFFYDHHLWNFSFCEYFLNGGSFLLLSDCLSATCPSPLFSLLAKFFLQMVPTYEIFLFVSEWISPPWWQLSSHSWLPFCFLSFSSLSSIAKYSRRYSIYCYRYTGLDTGHCIPGTVHRTVDTGQWTLDSGHWTADTGQWTLCTVHWTLDTGHWTLDTGHWTPDTGNWTLDTGHWTLDTGHWTLDTGHWTPDTGHRTLDTGHCTSDTAHWVVTGHCALDCGHWPQTLDLGHWAFDSGYYSYNRHWKLDNGLCILDTGNRQKPETDRKLMLDSWNWNWTLDKVLGTRHWTLETGHWTLDNGHWTLDTGHRTLYTGLWSLDTGLWTLDIGHWTFDSSYYNWTLDFGN